MSRSVFGWSYPPGAASDPNAPYNQTDGLCAVCCRDEVDCVCPECPECGASGDPNCYMSKMNPFNGHGMKLTREQVIGRAYAAVAVAQERVCDAQEYVNYLKAGGEFSDQLDENPDPYR